MKTENPSGESPDIEIIIPGWTANAGAFILFLILAIVGGAVFSYCWNIAETINSFRDFLTNYIALFVALILGMIAHEGAHMMVWAMYCKQGFRSVKPGFSVKNLSPYVHCSEFLKRGPFLAGALAPFVLTGLAPLVFGIISGSGWWFWLGAFLGAGAAGDIYSALRLLKFDSSVMVLDHPAHLGFIIKTSQGCGDQNIASPTL